MHDIQPLNPILLSINYSMKISPIYHRTYIENVDVNIVLLYFNWMFYPTEL